MTERVADGLLHGLTPEHACAAIEWRLYRLRRWLVQRKLDRKRIELERRVLDILSDEGPHRTMDSDELFSLLQAEYPPRPDYGYDAYATWSRASARASFILSLPQMRDRGKHVAEIGAGDGMVGRLLADYGHDVTLVDADDWRDDRAKNVNLLQCDVCSGIPAESESFDLVYSYYAFEHILKPMLAFQEMLRICRPGGLLFIAANPLYWSPWGLHASPALRMPYPQMLFSRGFVDGKIREMGNYDLSRTMLELQPLNHWRPAQYCVLWADERVEILHRTHRHDAAHLGMILRFPTAFSGLGLAYEDVVTEHAQVLLRKRAHP